MAIILPELLTSIFVLQLLIWNGSCYKIAITTPQVGSHLMGKLVIGKALVEKGHEVHLIVSDKYENLESIRKAGIKPLRYRARQDIFLLDSVEATKWLADMIFSGTDARDFDAHMSEHVYKDCEDLHNDPQALEVIKQHNFDLFIVEPFIVSPCNSLLPVYIGKPYISMTLFYSYLDIRSPALPSFFTVLDAPLTADNIESYTWKRKLTTISWILVSQKLDVIMPGHRTDLIKKYAPEFESWGNILRGSHLFLCELDHHLGGFPPVNPNFISVAGMTASKAKPLPENLEKIMEESGNDGVILLTFGATAYYMPDETVRKFFDGFSQINQTVLARFNAPDGMVVPKNVKLLSWLPQNDLLGHPKTKLFITHCGNSGQYEALYHAVPMLGFPMFAEQQENSQRAKDKGYGLVMRMLEFTSEELVSNINDIIYNPKYKNAISRASEIWRDQYNREAPLDRGTYWIEHVIKYGGRHLRSPAMELSLFEFLMLDVMLVVLLSVCAFVTVAVVVARVLYKKICSKRTNEKVKVK